MAFDAPRATYRVQLTKDFNFDDAAAIVPYLRQLGISHLYASPFLKARKGSTHGYDIVDHTQFNPELGGEESFLRLSDMLQAHGLGLILDFVPNHMGVGLADNDWWLDVLEWGQASPHARAFDIDWDGLPYRRQPGVLLPILGKPYGDALRQGEIKLTFDPTAGTFIAWYYEHKLPINPQRYSEMLRTLVHAASATDNDAGHAMITLAHKYRDPRSPVYRDGPDLKAALAAIDGASAIIERGLAAYDGATDQGAATLHRLLERQNYRLAYWRVAFSAVNYRRFFDINDLAGLRVEDPTTFRAIHPLVARLIAENRLQGLRLDHIDGLRDPAQYTRRLNQLVRKVRPKGQGPFTILVEKILGEGEAMPNLTAVQGTTGYEWLNVISRVLVDGKGLDPLDRIWRDFTGERASFPELLDTAKLRVIESMLASEFTVLTRALARIAAGHFSSRDYTLDRLRAALQLYVREFPVYRTYATAGGASEADKKVIEATIERARARWTGPDPDIFDFLREAVTLELASNGSYSAPRVRDFSLKLQQFTGPLTAKSMEDTAFYRHHRLIALNEVGGEADAHALSLDDFHAMQVRRVTEAPDSLTATATHDTKRGEDARARILALSEMPEDWAAAVTEWQALNAALLTDAEGHQRPSKAHQYMLYQALVGSWEGSTSESFVKRMQAYALKAAREGKQETSWTNPNETYEASLKDYVAALLDPRRSAAFLTSFAAFHKRPALLGALNSLSQLTLKATLPGVPDFYQGTEGWDFSLVDPDNRRPVDYDWRRNNLGKSSVVIDSQRINFDDGTLKLQLTHALLELRERYANLFYRGTYEPVPVTGEHANHIIAFKRYNDANELIFLVARHYADVTDAGRRWPSRFKFDIALSGKHADVLKNDSAFDGVSLRHRFSTLPILILRRL